MDEPPPSNVISLIDIGLKEDERYVQFVPPATFGVIFNRATTEVLLVLSNGDRSVLRRTADKIYTLRGFIALRRREERELELGGEVEDDIIRHILFMFGSLEKLREAVTKFCPLRENARVIAQTWGPCVFPEDEEGNYFPSIFYGLTRMLQKQSWRMTTDALRAMTTRDIPPPRSTALLCKPARWTKFPLIWKLVHRFRTRPRLVEANKWLSTTFVLCR